MKTNRTLGLIATALLLAMNAPAATYTWTGSGFLGEQDYLWSNPFNWAGLAAPSAGEPGVIIVFPDNAAPKMTTNDIAGLTVAAIQFQGSNYVVHGKPSGNTLALFGTGFGGWNLTAAGNGNYFAGSSPLTFNNTGAVSVATNCTFSVLSAISGPGGFSKFNSGTLKFAAAAANTYAGGTTVVDGTIDLNNGQLFPTLTYISIPGPLVIGGTNNAWNPRVRLLMDHQIANSASVTVGDNGRLWLNGHDDVIGPLTVWDSGQVSTGLNGGDTSPGLLTLNGNVTNRMTFQSGSAFIRGRVDFGGLTRTVHVDYSLHFPAVLSGSGPANPGLTKTGTGILHLTGANTYSGETLIQEGGLYLTGSKSMLGSTNSGTTVFANAFVRLDDARIGNEPLVLFGNPGGFSDLSCNGSNHWAGPITLNGSCEISVFNLGGVSPAVNLSGPISGSGSLRMYGDGDLHLTGNQANTFTGGLVCESGTVWLNKSPSVHAFSGPLTVSKEGNKSQWTLVRIQQPHQVPDSQPILLLDRGALQTENGVAETVGPVEIKGGLLGGSSSALISLAGHVTNRFSTNGPGYLVGGITLPASRIIHCDAGSQLRFAFLEGPGGIVKTGPGELFSEGASSYDGQTYISEGVVHLKGAARLGSGLAGTIVLPDALLRLEGVAITNEVLELHGGGGDDGVALVYDKTNTWNGQINIGSGAVIQAEPAARLNVLGAIAGTQGLHHTGAGELLLGGNAHNTFGGGMFFREGTLLLAKNGAHAIPGSLVAGSAINGSPSATIRALAHNQFAPAPGPSALTTHFTLHPNAAFDGNGFFQTVPNLILNGALAQTGAGILSVPGDIEVNHAGGGSSYLLGTLQFVTGAYSTSHDITVNSNAVLWCYANLIESGAQHLFKRGSGAALSAASNLISGALVISEGIWAAGGNHPFGSAGFGTIVQAGASLATFSGTFTEPLTLEGAGVNGEGALQVEDSGVFTGAVTLSADAVVRVATNQTATMSGVIAGTGGLIKNGPGTLQLSGTNANTYAGATVINDGKVELGKAGAIAIPGSLTINAFAGNNSHAYLLQPDQIYDQSAVVLNGNGWLALNGMNETIGSLSGNGAIFQFAHHTGLLTVGANDASTTFSGIIHGGGGLTKVGGGTLTITGNNLYSGSTTISGGTLNVFGQQPQSQVSILSAGRIGGTGRVGNVSALNGHTSPGASPGILVCSNYSTFSPANLLEIEINGTAPGSQYDQLQVHGSVLLMGGNLKVAMNFAGAVSNEFVIIQNDASDVVTGTFTGLPEGAMLTNNGAVFQITYQGGDGNDVVLIQKSTAAPGAAAEFTGIKRLGDGTMEFMATGTPGALHTVQAASSLTPPVEWTDLGTVLADAEGVIHFIDPDAAQFPMRFYRMRNP